MTSQFTYQISDTATGATFLEPDSESCERRLELLQAEFPDHEFLIDALEIEPASDARRETPAA